MTEIPGTRANAVHPPIDWVNSRAMRRELSLAALALAVGCHATSSAPHNPPVPSSATARAAPRERISPEARADVERRLSSLLARLRRVTSVSGNAIGEGGEPGEFFLLWLEFQKTARPNDFYVLAEDSTPIVRAMGFQGLAQGPRDDAARRLLLHVRDRAKVDYFPGGCIGSGVPLGAFVRALLEDAHHLGSSVTYPADSEPPASSVARPLLAKDQISAVDLEILARDELAGLPYESAFHLSQAVSEHRLALDLRTLLEVGRFRDLDPLAVIKAIGRIDANDAGVRRGVTELLIGALHDPHLPRLARVAAASALTRFPDERVVGAIESERAFLGALATRFENEIRLRRQHDALMAPLRKAKWASETERRVDRAARAYAEDHPLALDDLLNRLSFGEQDERIATLRVTTLLRMAARFPEFSSSWDTYGDAPYRIAWNVDPDYHVFEDADRKALARLEAAVRRFASRN